MTAAVWQKKYISKDWKARIPTPDLEANVLPLLVAVQPEDEVVRALGLWGEEGRHPQLGRGLLGLRRAEEQLRRVNALPVVVPWKENEFFKKWEIQKKFKGLNNVEQCFSFRLRKWEKILPNYPLDTGCSTMQKHLFRHKNMGRGGPCSVMVTLVTLKQEVRGSNPGAAPPKFGAQTPPYPTSRS